MVRCVFTCDARLTNMLFERAPAVTLATLSNIEVEFQEGDGFTFESGRILSHFRLHRGVGEVSDAFHRM